MSKFCVAGSLNIDLVTVMDRFPKPGETVHGESFHTFTGGKGANQAVALAKLGADTAMIGMVGNDVYADQYLKYFKELGVNSDGVAGVDTSTGIAVISVESSGENSIIIIAGANGMVDSGYIKSRSGIIKEADFLLLQLEIPMDAVTEAARVASQNNTLVILDPAPAGVVKEELLKLTDIITPNETEAQVLTGIKPVDESSFRSVGELLIKKGVKTAVMKAGADGAYIYQDGAMTHVKGFAVDAVDTTAAGDTFNAGLAYGLGCGLSLKEAVRYANAAAALATTKVGAQSGMPSAEDVKRLL